MKLNHGDIGILLDIFENKKKDKDSRDKITALFAIDILLAIEKTNCIEINDSFFLEPSGHQDDFYNYEVYIISEETKRFINKDSSYTYNKNDYFGFLNYIIHCCSKYLQNAWSQIQVELYLLKGLMGKIDKPEEDIDGIEYERICSEFLKNAGFFNVTNVGRSGDQGVDIIAYDKNNLKYAVQCKYYSKPVSNKAIQEVYSGARYYGCDKSIVITNNIFTQSAQELALSLGVVLMGGMTVFNMNNPLERNVELVEEGYAKKRLKKDYDPLLERVIKVAYSFGGVTPELLHSVLKISYSRCDNLINQLNDIGIIIKYPIRIISTLIPRKVSFDNDYLYIYWMDEKPGEIIDYSICELGKEEKEYVLKQYDDKLYTDEITIVDRDYSITRIWINSDVMTVMDYNHRVVVNASILGLYRIEKGKSQISLFFDPQSVYGHTNKNDVILLNNVVSFRYDTDPQKSNVKKIESLISIIKARIDTVENSK